MTMTLVSTVTVGSGGAASIEFTGIAGTGKDLLILFSARSSTDAGNDFLVGLLLNGSYDTSAKTLRGYGDGVISNNWTYPYQNRGGATANTFSSNSIYITNYAGSSNKIVSIDAVTENNGTEAHQSIQTGFYGSSAVTSVTLSASMAQHSTASLYIIS